MFIGYAMGMPKLNYAKPHRLGNGQACEVRSCGSGRMQELNNIIGLEVYKLLL